VRMRALYIMPEGLNCSKCPLSAGRRNACHGEFMSQVLYTAMRTHCTLQSSSTGDDMGRDESIQHTQW
jgi:hypothetical protein